MRTGTAFNRLSWGAISLSKLSLYLFEFSDSLLYSYAIFLLCDKLLGIGNPGPVDL
jgi:hypothetical protein